MNSYVGVLKMLSNAESLRLFAHSVDLEVLTEIAINFNAVVDDIRQDTAREALSQQEREKKKAALLAIISDEGFSVEELAGVNLQKQPARKYNLEQILSKYQYTSEGVTKFWSGRGRRPKPIQQAIKEGKSLDDFLIP